jgi:hypothetical protein
MSSSDDREVAERIVEEWVDTGQLFNLPPLKAAIREALTTARTEQAERVWKEAIQVAKDELWSDAITEQYPHRAEQNLVTKCVIDALEAAAIRATAQKEGEQ